MLHSILLVITDPLLETTSVSSRQEVMQLSLFTLQKVFMKEHRYFTITYLWLSYDRKHKQTVIEIIQPVLHVAFMA
jgi:hypothetical protein